MAGADRVYASGHDALDAYPHYTTVVEMCVNIQVAPDDMAQLFPVTEQTVKRWREIYNQSMRHVHNSGTLETRDEKRILESGGAYFVHRNGELLGLGWLEQDTILAIASAKPGMGQHVAHTLMSVVEGASLRLEVASTNEKALRLYEKLGFLKTGEISRWYKVL
jgi:ribosomal protein S18 acetylase RimI-like enzyme